MITSSTPICDADKTTTGTVDFAISAYLTGEDPNADEHYEDTTGYKAHPKLPDCVACKKTGKT